MPVTSKHKITTINLSLRQDVELEKIAMNRRTGDRRPSRSELIAEAIEFWLKNRPKVSVPGSSSR